MNKLSLLDLTRYRANRPDETSAGGLTKDPQGDWVRFSDLEAALAAGTEPSDEECLHAAHVLGWFRGREDNARKIERVREELDRIRGAFGARAV